MTVPSTLFRASDAPPRVVLDTNAVLDWLVFGDAAALPFAAAVESTRVTWHATAEMRSELAAVLTRGTLHRWPFDAGDVLGRWDRFVRTGPAAPAASHGALRCSDPDDQKFIDLAIHLGAAALVTKDRALLRLARAARRHGVEVLTPSQWREAR